MQALLKAKAPQHGADPVTDSLSPEEEQAIRRQVIAEMRRVRPPVPGKMAWSATPWPHRD